jgi:hypothetical protein
MSSYKKFNCNGTLRQVFICLRTPPLLRPIPPLFTRCIRVYCTVCLFTQRRGGEMNQREGWRGNSSQSWVENTNMTGCIFYMTTFSFGGYVVNWSMVGCMHCCSQPIYSSPSISPSICVSSALSHSMSQWAWETGTINSRQ